MKKIIITIVAALAMCLAANSQEVMKVEMKNGQVATFNVEDINRFYFVGAEQQEELATDCKISIMDEVVIQHGVAIELGYDEGIVKMYYYWLKASQAVELTTEQMQMLVVSKGDVATKDQKYISCYLPEEGTDYVLLFVGFNANGKHGELYWHGFRSKISENELKANVDIYKYDNQYFYYTVDVGNNVLDYLVLADVGNNLDNNISADLPLFALNWKKLVGMGQISGPYYGNNNFYASRPNGENSVRVLTWVRDLNGNYSGVIMSDVATINSNSRLSEPFMPIKSNGMQLVSKAFSEEEVMKMFDFAKMQVISE